MRRLLLILFAAVLLNAACGDDETVASGPDDAGQPDASDPAGAWVLSGGMLDGEPVTPIPAYEATLTIETMGQVGGTAACNSYGGTASIEGDGGFSLGDVAVTEMACEPDVMDLESRFLTALTRADRWEVSDDVLVLAGADAELAFDRLPPVPQAELVGTRWLLDTLFDGDTASTTLGEATLLLSDDGTFTGSTGCRTLTGEWLISGSRLLFPSMSADGQCSPELADQDGFVIAVLEGPGTVEIDGPVLRLTAPGDQGLGYRAEGR